MKPEEKALEMAQLALLMNPKATFFASVALSLKHKFLVHPDLPTAGTDGVNIYYNPEYFMGLEKKQRIGLVFHEVCHVAFMHNERNLIRQPDEDKQKEEHGRWNIACDHEINITIDKAGFELPPDPCLDYNYLGKTAEEIFLVLPEDAKPPSGGVGIDLMPGNPSNKGIPGTGGKPGQGTEPLTPAQQKAQKVKLDNILVKAQIQAKIAGCAPGDIPGSLERYLDELLNPKIAWHKHLKRFTNTIAKNDYSLQRPNRRFLPEFYLPSLYSLKVGPVACTMDASGSVSQEDFTQYTTETMAILKQLRPEYITFVQFDTRIIAEDRITCTADFNKVQLMGGGGTQIGPVMEWTQKNKPIVNIIFTDGYFTEPEIKPRTPVIWVIYNNPDFTAPFGQVIHYSPET